MNQDSDRYAPGYSFLALKVPFHLLRSSAPRIAAGLGILHKGKGQVTTSPGMESSQCQTLPTLYVSS